MKGILKKLGVGLFDKLLLYTCHKHGPLNHVGGSLGMGLRGDLFLPHSNRRRRAGFRSDADYSSAECLVYAA